VREVIMLGGPNGAGKTTAAATLLPQALGIREFVNADEIARGLSPFNPEGAAVAAGRLMLARIRALARAGESFGFETTCAGQGYARLLRTCRAAGYRLSLLPMVDIAAIYDNADDAGTTLIAERTPGATLVVHDPARWALIEEMTR
jgi:predicted ABC-type ATPase